MEFFVWTFLWQKYIWGPVWLYVTLTQHISFTCILKVPRILGMAFHLLNAIMSANMFSSSGTANHHCHISHSVHPGILLSVKNRSRGWRGNAEIFNPVSCFLSVYSVVKWNEELCKNRSIIQKEKQTSDSEKSENVSLVAMPKSMKDKKNSSLIPVKKTSNEKSSKNLN